MSFSITFYTEDESSFCFYNTFRALRDWLEKHTTRNELSADEIEQLESDMDSWEFERYRLQLLEALHYMRKKVREGHVVKYRIE